jgi:flagellar motor protein MotB
MGSPGAAASIIEPLVTVNTQVESDIMRVADGAPSDRAADSLEQSLATHHLEGASWLERRPEGLVVSVDGRVAFAPGTDTLTPRALAFLQDFARVAAAVDTNVAAEAFVANPLDPYRDDAHWALAAERADAVATTLLRFGVSGARLSASAYGYPGGRDELRFLQQQELLELTLLTGPNTAVPAE